jgi:hypothetical protein
MTVDEKLSGAPFERLTKIRRSLSTSVFAGDKQATIWLRTLVIFGSDNEQGNRI